MTTNEKWIAGGIVVVGGVLLFSHNANAATLHAPVVHPDTSTPGWLQALMQGLAKAAPALGFGGGPGGGGSSGGGSGGGGSFGSGGGLNPAGDRFNFIGNLTNGDNDLNFDGSLGSGPLSFSDETTVDLNLINPDTGDTFFQVPTQPDGGDSSGILADVYASMNNDPYYNFSGGEGADDFSSWEGIDETGHYYYGDSEGNELYL